MPMYNHSDNFSDAEAPLDDEALWDMLSLYVDGEADPRQAAIVEQMLSSDPAYRRDFDFLMQSAKSMHAIEEIAPPVGLRDAIYAQTSRRPTLVGRLRAAWTSLISQPFGRYATIGGAFTVAALAVLFSWPHQNHGSSGSSNTPVVATNAPTTHPDERVAVNTPAPSTVQNKVPNIELGHFENAVLVHPTKVERKELAKNTQDKGKLKQTPDVHKANEAHLVSVDKTPHKPDTHAMKLVSNVDPATTPTYSYDRTMDQHVAPHGQNTIFNSDKADIGPMVAVHEEPVAKIVKDDQTPTQPDPETKKEPTTPVVDKPRIRVAAALPPEAKQNIAASLIRRDMNTRYSGYDRNVAENIQRHEVTIDVIKGSF